MTHVMNLRDDFLGTGLSLWAWLVVLTVSLLFFSFWGGPIWHMPSGSVYLTRITVSYLVVIPVACLALMLSRRLNGPKIITLVICIWGVKFVVTSLMYQVVVNGHALAYNPAPVAKHRLTEHHSLFGRYNAAPRGFPNGTLTLQMHPTQVDAQVIAFLKNPRPGRQPAKGKTVTATIHRHTYDKQLYIIGAGDIFNIINKDFQLHTLHFSLGKKSTYNDPLLPGRTRSLSYLRSGLQFVFCDMHPHEYVTLIKLDHPYIGQFNKDGIIGFDGVPVGPNHVVVLAIKQGGMRILHQRVDVKPNTNTVLAIDVATGPWLQVKGTVDE